MIHSHLPLLEANAVLNGKYISIINTSMNINVIMENNKVKSVYGEFTYFSDLGHYTKKTTIRFSSDENWKHECDCIPEIGLIDFDKKLIQLK